MALATLVTVQEMLDFRRRLERAGTSLAFVPTMGALHAGHLSLVARAKEQADYVLVSIFVNPTQFGAGEDFSKYPRPLARDLELLQAAGAQGVFTPEAGEMFPLGYQTYVDNVKLANLLCGKDRPGHFRGVCTVVMKFLQVIRPELVLLGKKDYQQLKIVEAMVADLHLPVRVQGCELVRDADGLALSSRNAYLTPEQRRLARHLSQGLFAAKALYEGGQRQAAPLVARVEASLAAAGEGVAVDYVQLRRQRDLGELGPMVAEPAILLAAIRVGGVRLIDNVELG